MTDIYVSPERSKRGCFLISFLAILFLGFIYIVRRGALKWE